VDVVIVIGSLFAGVGGLDLGLEAAFAEADIRARIAWQVEIDPFCRSILARHWPEADRSVTDVRAASSLPSVDLLCGGFPCQDVSSAGKGAGLAGERSGLWFAFRDVIAALEPGVVVVENVASGKKRWVCRVWSDLRALGYRTRAIQIGACDVGAPHRRERIFVVAVGDAGGLGGRVRALAWGRDVPDAGRGRLASGAHAQTREPEPDGRGALGDPDPTRREGPERASACRSAGGSPVADPLDDADLQGRQRADAGSERAGLGERGAASDGRRLVEAQPGVGGGAHGLPPQVDLPARWPAARGQPQEVWEPPRTVTGREPNRRARLRALGNAVVPAQAREVARAAIVPLFARWT
jgi:DNA (cytosine-5)-methyltransferase 1